MAEHASFSSLFNLQSKSISVKFGHFSANTKAIALLFGQKCLIFITFQSAIKLNQCHIWSFFSKIPRLYPYFLAKNASFSSLFNLQSNSISVKFGHLSAKYQGYSLTSWADMPHFHHFPICNQNQSVSNLVIFQQNTNSIGLLFGQKCLIFITFQSAIKINQCQIWSFISKYQGYSLTFWAKMPHCLHFSICNQNQSVSNLVIFQQNTKAIALLFGQQCLIFITFQSEIKINQCQMSSVFSKIPRL